MILPQKTGDQLSLNFEKYSTNKNATDCAADFHVLGGCAAENCGADYVSSLSRHLAPEQGTGPVTVNRTIKLKFACTLPGAGQHRSYT